MLFGEVVFGDVAELIHGGEVELPALGAVKDGLPLGGVQELSLLVEELERVPLAGVVRRGEDDATVRVREDHGHFGGGR